MADAARFGELMALGTALAWTFTAVFFTFAGNRIGSLAVNRTRLVFGVLFLMTSCWITQGTPFPLAAPRHWFWFGLSGLVGLALGDSFLFQSLLDIGPRKAVLVMSSWPIFSALMALAFLGESLSLPEDAGIALTIAGIAWVVMERTHARVAIGSNHLVRGICFAFGGAVCQAAGIVMAKQGLDGAVSSLSGTLIRMIVATAGIWAVTAAAGRLKNSLLKLKDRKALLFTTLGAFTGPFLGVWMSLVAVEYAKVGVASALMALMPVLMIPMARVVFKERVTLRAILGTLASFAGVLLLFLAR